MGKSVGKMKLAGVTQATVLATAQGFGTEEGWKIIDQSPNHITFSRGGTMLSGERVLRIRAQDVHGGVDVGIEAWARPFFLGQSSANPRALLGFFARRAAWNSVVRFLGRLGVTQPENMFAHE